MFIQTESTPNPATLKFLPGRAVMGEGAVADFANADAGNRSPMARALFAVDGVSRVFFGSDFISVTKADTSEWQHLKPALLGAIMEHFTKDLPLIEGSAEESETDDAGADPEIVAQIKELIDTRVRPAVAQDGGDIIYKGFDGSSGIVFLHMRGSCAGCPSSTMTLKNGIENMLRHYVPEVNAVEAVRFNIGWGNRMTYAVSDEGLDIIFRNARTQNSWQDKTVSDAILMAVYDLMRWGPTSANVSPARIVFVKTPEAKERLKPHLSATNAVKTMQAPVCAIIGHDLNFAESIPKLFPHNPGAKDWFKAPAVRDITAFRNGTLQAGYFIVAARSLGLDCGPMSGFNNDGVDKEFFAGTDIKSNLLCNLGYGDPAGLFERSPRLSFDEACKIL